MVALVVANLLVVGLAATTTVEDRNSRREVVFGSVNLAAALLSEELDHALQRVDLELQTIADEVSHGQAGTAPAAMADFLTRHRARLSGVTGLDIISAEGTVLFQSHTLDPGPPQAGAEYFIRLRDDRAAGLVVSRPVAAPDNRQRLLFISRRIEGADGRFLGIVRAVLPSESLVRLFHGIHPVAGMHISLLNGDLEFIARFPAVGALDKAAIVRIPSDELRALIVSGAVSGRYHAISRLDGQARTAMMRKIPGHPLYLSVGIADEVFLAPWCEEALRIWLVVGLFLVGSVVLARIERRAWADRDAATAALEAAHAESRCQAERLDLVLRGSNDGWWDWNVVAGRTHHSPAWWRMYGLDACRVEDRPDLWYSLVHPDDLPAIRAEMDRLIASDAVGFQYEARMLHADGHYLPVLVRGHIRRDGEGRAVRITGANTDLSALRAAEAALRTSEATLRAMFELSPFGLARIAPDGTLLDINGTLLTLLGYRREAMTGHELSGLVPAAGPGEAGRQRELLDCSGWFGPFETELTAAEGRAVPVRLRGVWIAGSGDGLGSVYVIVEDVTEERRMLRALEERSRDLIRSNADLEQYAYVASHDLREPLRMVASFLALLDRRFGDKLDAESRQFIGFAMDGAKRMDRLILDLLDFSRIGRSEMAAEPVPVRPAIDQAIRNLTVLAEENGATIEVDPGLDVATVRVDAAHLTSLFQNLIGNAIKYRSPDRPLRVRLDGEKVGEEWVFRVSDNGIGIEPQYHERIFRIFQRLHTRESHEGTGIGLALCRKIVEHHGGRIGVDSVFGEGSVFSVTLPVIAAGEVSR